ncbi:MAG TPA: HD domain-containing protein [Bacilli bacterium]|nr:HD domain-containing protein [Bacilli bacterium]
MKEDKLIKFYNEIENLKTTTRYNTAPSIFLESTADHTWRVSVMALDLKEKYDLNIDILHAIKIALIHDLGEYNQDNDVTIVDVINNKITKKQKDEMELESIMNLTIKYNRKDILKLWEEYENQSSKEAKYIKLIDKMESMLHILDKIENGYIINNLTDDIIYADKYIKDFPELLPFLRIIKQKYKKVFKKIGIKWLREYDI